MYSYALAAAAAKPSADTILILYYESIVLLKSELQ